jgi:hypothetical protein
MEDIFLVFMLLCLSVTAVFAEEVKEMPEQFCGKYISSIVSTDQGYSYKQMTTQICIANNTNFTVDGKKYSTSYIEKINDEEVHVQFDKIHRIWIIKRVGESNVSVIVIDTKKNKEIMRIVAKISDDGVTYE